MNFELIIIIKNSYDILKFKICYEFINKKDIVINVINNKNYLNIWFDFISS